MGCVLAVSTLPQVRSAMRVNVPTARHTESALLFVVSSQIFATGQSVLDAYINLHPSTLNSGTLKLDQYLSFRYSILGGSWVVRSGVISRVTMVIIHIRGQTPLITTHILSSTRGRCGCCQCSWSVSCLIHGLFQRPQTLLFDFLKPQSPKP